jgi:hypothetical protein
MSNLNWRNVKLIIQWIILCDHLIVICAKAFLKEDFFCWTQFKFCIHFAYIECLRHIHKMSSLLPHPLPCCTLLTPYIIK